MELYKAALEISDFPKHSNEEFPWRTLFEDIQYVACIKMEKIFINQSSLFYRYNAF